ncbi:MAG: formate dehydrogenase accessory sulfurtransferase FdhD [Oscillospiraceae bacterium]|nr:formate dehydrogenase accessory sulfurtransferase FdhD [Oscillospiraceae bacterium]
MNNSAQADALSRSYSFYIVRRNGEKTSERQESLMIEHQVRVYLNGLLTYILTSTLDRLPELVIGHLRTERIIRTIDDVDDIRVDNGGRSAYVTLHEHMPDRAEAQPERCSTSESKICTLSNVYRTRFPLEPIRSIPYELSWIFHLADTLGDEHLLPLYGLTHNSHCCMLMREGEILLRIEDVGRHNALDKVIGWALMNRVALNQCIVFTTGRLAEDMVQKVVAAGIPVMVTKAMPTDQAIQLALRHNISVICAAHSDGLKILTNSGAAFDSKAPAVSKAI